MRQKTIIAQASLMLLLTGCSGLSFTRYLVPENTNSSSRIVHEELGMLEFGVYPLKIDYDCGDIKLTIHSVPTSRIEMIGPPIVPVPLPFPTLSVDDYKPLCIIIRSDKKIQPFKILSTVIEYDENYYTPEVKESTESHVDNKVIEWYFFKFSEKYMKNMTLRLETNESKCQIIEIPFHFDQHVLYSIM